MILYRLPSLASRVCVVPLFALAAAATDASLAQSTPAGSASGAASDLTAAERAQRDTDKVFKWILIHSDKPRKQAPAREEKPVAAAPARPKPAPTTSAGAAAPAVRAGASAASPKAPVAIAATTATAGVAAVASEATQAAPAVTELAAAAPLVSPTGGSAALASKAVATPEADEPLTPLLRAAPQFPPSLLRTLRKGQVQVRFTVVPDGSVSERAVVSSSNIRLNETALAAVAKWRFTPLRHAQEAVVELSFDLD